MKILYPIEILEGNTPKLDRIIVGWLLFFVVTYIAGLISLVYVVVGGLL
jgi:hypothetical protein